MNRFDNNLKINEPLARHVTSRRLLRNWIETIIIDWRKCCLIEFVTFGHNSNLIYILEV